jgi:pyruvyltransferase
MNDAHVTVSVVISSFNKGKFLQDSVDSALSQTFTDYEIIIVDDASDDGFSTNIALSFASEKIHVFVNDKNLGVCSTRNYAISEACGKYILPLDAGDKIDMTYLKKSVPLIDSGIADVIYSMSRSSGAKNHGNNLPKFSIHRILYRNIVSNCALFKKEDWICVGGYSELFEDGYEGWDFWLSFLEHEKKFYQIVEPLLIYSERKVCRNIDLTKKYDTIAKIIFDRHKDLYHHYCINAAPRLSDTKKLKKRFSPFFSLFRVVSNWGQTLMGRFFPSKYINLNYYNVENCPNFGDVLNLPLIEKLSGKNVRHANSKTSDSLCIGSLLDGFLLKRGKMPYPGRPLHVWGSGFIAAEGMHPNLKCTHEEQFSREMVFHAVRGYSTLNRLRRMNCNVQSTVVGDPGLLASYIYPMTHTSKKFLIGFLPHYADVSEPVFQHLRNRFSNSTILNVFDPPEILLERMNECELILSSAMHGLIAADSYGIPNIWLRISDNLTGGDYKFVDYYSVYSLSPRHVGLSDALNLTTKDIMRIIDEYPIKSTMVRNIQENLLASCPWRDDKTKPVLISIHNSGRMIK